MRSPGRREPPQKVLRPLYLVHPPFRPLSIAGLNDCLVPVSVSTPAAGHRPQSLRSSHWQAADALLRLGARALRRVARNGIMRGRGRRHLDADDAVDAAEAAAAAACAVVAAGAGTRTTHSVPSASHSCFAPLATDFAIVCAAV